jgi:D-alanyl-D-alanine endopeptidase (penicillin-binding protein 7)
MLWKNVLKNLLIIVLLISATAQANQHKQAVKRPNNGILATSYVVQDLDTGEILAERNSNEVRSIASITKLMTAVVIIDANQDLNEVIHVAPIRGIHSRLGNVKLTRSELILLALMSSDNLAAKTLALNYPGGELEAIAAMNKKASALLMSSTAFADPTGLYDENVSTSRDLVKLLSAVEHYPLLKKYSTNSSYRVEVPGKKRSKIVDFHTTNKLVTSIPEIVISKTGWIQKSGGCLLLGIHDRGRRLAVILLNSRNTHTRIRDAELLYRLQHGKSI